MRRFAVVIFVALGGNASAEPPVSFGLDYAAGRGSRLEQIDLGWRLEAGLFVQVGPWHAVGSFSGYFDMKSDDVKRDSDQLDGYTLGGHLSYHHGAFQLGAGFERVWVHSATTVVRPCRFTDACIAGYYTESPHYDAWTPQLRLGIGAWAPSREVKLGITFEVIIERLSFANVPPDGIAGFAAWAALTGTVGAIAN